MVIPGTLAEVYRRDRMLPWRLTASEQAAQYRSPREGGRHIWTPSAPAMRVQRNDPSTSAQASCILQHWRTNWLLVTSIASTRAASIWQQQAMVGTLVQSTL